MKNKSLLGISEFSEVFLLLFLILFPFNIKLSLITLVIYFILTAKSNFRKLSTGISNSSLLIFSCILFYLLHVVSLIYSENKLTGLKDIETKFGFFIFPVIALFFPRTDMQKKTYMNGFVYSLAFASIVCIFNAGWNCFITGDLSEMYYDKFSFLMHPTYFTMHLAIALVFHFYLCYSNDRDIRFSKSELMNVTLSCILLVAIFLTSSRAGILFALIAALLMLSGRIVKLSILPRRSIYILGVTSVLMAGVILFGNTRYSLVYNELAGSAQTVTDESQAVVDENPVAHRFKLMGVAVNVAADNPFGVGAGDVHDILIEKYKEIGYNKAVVMRYNPHNQFLQTAVALGIPGVVVLLIFVLALILAYKSRGAAVMLFFVGLIVVLNGLFESVFEVQRGVLLVTIIIAFLFDPSRLEARKNSEQ